MSSAPLNEVAAAIQSRRSEIEAATVRRLYQCRPELSNRYGLAGQQKCQRDIGYHLEHLAEALRASAPGLFVAYVAWAKVLLAGLHIPVDDLKVSLECQQEAIQELLPAAVSQPCCAYIDQSLERLPAMPAEIPTLLVDGAPHVETARDYLQVMLAGERHRAGRMILDAVSRGVPVKSIYLHVFQPAQREIGRLWQINKLSVAQEHYCTAATQMIMSQLYPHIMAGEKKGLRLVATCVSDELHEMGMRMVSDVFEMDGWDTYYLGANLPAAEVVKTLKQRQPQLLAVSATLTTHMSAVMELIRRVRNESELVGLNVLVGGYVFNQAPLVWKEVGADGYASDAEGALAEANHLVEAA